MQLSIVIDMSIAQRFGLERGGIRMRAAAGAGPSDSPLQNRIWVKKIGDLCVKLDSGVPGRGKLIEHKNADRIHRSVGYILVELRCRDF
jgi:hypothetical protein